MISSLGFWQVDAFTTDPFKGNPAAVLVLYQELSDELMQSIAVEMNLSETAFVLIRKDEPPLLRWFTPNFEIDLCGHATLASGHILMSEIYNDLNEIVFDTKFVGPISVVKTLKGYCMDFPSRLGEKQNLKDIPNFLLDAITSAARPHTVYKSRDLMLVYEDEQVVYDIDPDFSLLKKFDDFIIVTAKSKDSKYDFVSRFFCADDGISEDPVTGSSHSTLAPYWAKIFDKNILKAYQASKRGGELWLEVGENRVMIEGEAVTVITGKINF